jgi:hypothetical protein
MVPHLNEILDYRRLTPAIDPSPGKSRYRHVGFAGFPVGDNPVSQDLAGQERGLSNV